MVCRQRGYMFIAMYKGEGEFWKSLITVMMVIIGLTAILLIAMPIIPKDFYMGVAIGISALIIITVTWATISLYRCSHNANSRIAHHFGKICAIFLLAAGSYYVIHLEHGVDIYVVWIAFLAISLRRNHPSNR